MTEYKLAIWKTRSYSTVITDTARCFESLIAHIKENGFFDSNGVFRPYHTIDGIKILSEKEVEEIW